MKKVTILGTHNTMATTIFGPMDILNQAGRLWNHVLKSCKTPLFEVKIASADGNSLKTLNNINIQPHCSIKEIQQTDLIIISSTTFIDKIMKKNPELISWLCEQYIQGSHIASICTGAFLLAETGLLDGKSATLHWGFKHVFRKRYPNVNLACDRMLIDHGRLYCSAGVSAGLDLTLYIVEKFYSRQVASESAKAMVLDLAREKQTPYEYFLAPADHGDPIITRAQKWMEAHQTEQIDYERMAKKFHISRRSMERRFKQALGMTPLAYLQNLRVEYAKQLLEEGILTFNEITYQVGYEDISFFRKVFIRNTGLRPKEYQQRFMGFSNKTGS